MGALARAPLTEVVEELLALPQIPLRAERAELSAEAFGIVGQRVAVLLYQRCRFQS